MIQINILPYRGILFLAESKADFVKSHQRLFKQTAEIEDDVAGKWSFGSCELRGKLNGMRCHLIYAHDIIALTHEVEHAMIVEFKESVIDPTDSDGEAFCHMTSHVLSQILSKKKYSVKISKTHYK